MRVLKRPQFLSDLAEELTWLRDKAGAEVAEEWYQALKATIHLLERHPRLGRERKDLSPRGIRTWRVTGFPRWLLIYEVDRHDTLILYRVRQRMMDLTQLKMES